MHLCICTHCITKPNHCERCVNVTQFFLAGQLHHQTGSICLWILCLFFVENKYTLNAVMAGGGTGWWGWGLNKEDKGGEGRRAKDEATTAKFDQLERWESVWGRSRVRSLDRANRRLCHILHLNLTFPLDWRIKMTSSSNKEPAYQVLFFFLRYMFSSVSAEQQRKGGEVHARNISWREEKSAKAMSFRKSFKGGEGHYTKALQISRFRQISAIFLFFRWGG